jgi:hypothetical protein
MRRKLSRRSPLRAVNHTELAFREMLALRGALIEAGEDMTEIVPGFFKVEGGCMPMLVVRDGKPEAFGWVLDEHKFAQTQAELDDLWRQWVQALHERGHLEEMARAAYQSCRYSKPGGARRVREALAKAFSKEAP